MKVLVIGDSGRWIGGKQMLILELLREAGHEVVYETPYEQAKRRHLSGVHIFSVYDECQSVGVLTEPKPKPKHQPKGPRGRWGKLK